MFADKLVCIPICILIEEFVNETYIKVHSTWGNVACSILHVEEKWVEELVLPCMSKYSRTFLMYS